jgi:hypothetical protein
VQRLQAIKPPPLDDRFTGLIRISDNPNGAKPAMDDVATKTRIAAAAAAKPPEERAELERRTNEEVERALAN